MYAVAYKLGPNSLGYDFTLLSENGVDVFYVTEGVIAVRSASIKKLTEFMLEYFVITEDEILSNIYHYDPITGP